MSINATAFSPDGPHAGTLADPWPGVSIKLAIDSLAGATDTVIVADGIWLFDAELDINRANWTLQGQSLSAVLRFVNPSLSHHDAGIWVNSDSTTRANISFSTLTLDAGNLGINPANDYSVVRVSLATNSSFVNCQILGHGNGGRPAMFWEGGGNNTFTGNTFLSGPAGGDNCIQLQPLGATSGWTFSNNTADSINLVFIGLSDLVISNNTLTNTALNNTCMIQVCGGSTAGLCSNVLITNNTVNCGSANGGVICGLPNDPGLGSFIDGFQITNNHVTGASALIAAQSFDGANFFDGTLTDNQKTNVIISGNTITGNNAGQFAAINIMGGTGGAGGGLVDIVAVRNNTFVFASAAKIQSDIHTTNATICGNISATGFIDLASNPRPEYGDPCAGDGTGTSQLRYIVFNA